ncbi:hypothetical protein ACLESO_04960 [Pyxidicoccus sp. 3LG]
MINRKSIASVVFASTLLLGMDAVAQGSCVFHAPDSTYYHASSTGNTVYAYGPISFVWEPSTGRILGGYYVPRVVFYTPEITAFNNVTSGTITPGLVNVNLDFSVRILFTRTVPNHYWAELKAARLTGTPNAAKLSGMLDGSHPIEAVGTVKCSD